MSASSCSSATVQKSGISARKSSTIALKAKHKYDAILHSFAIGRDLRWIERQHDITREQMEATLRARIDLLQRFRSAAEGYIELLDPAIATDFRAECAEVEAEVYEDLDRPVLKPAGRAAWRRYAIPAALALLGFALLHDDIRGALLGLIPAARPLLARVLPLTRRLAVKVGPKLLAAARHGWHLIPEARHAFGRSRRAA